MGFKTTQISKEELTSVDLITAVELLMRGWNNVINIGHTCYDHRVQAYCSKWIQVLYPSKDTYVEKCVGHFAGLSLTSLGINVFLNADVFLSMYL